MDLATTLQPLAAPPLTLEIRGDTGRVLLRIDAGTSTVTGELDDMGEAAAAFVAEVRKMLVHDPIRGLS